MKDSTEPTRIRFSRLALSALGSAVLIAIPLALFNPELARTPFEWAQLLGGLTLVSGFFALLGWFWSVRRRVASPAVPWALLAGTALAALGAGSIAAGWLGVGLAVVAFGALALAWRLRKPAMERRLRQVLLPAAAFSVVSGAVVLAGGSSADRQVVFVGLDGADWPIIDRLREQDRLPTFDRLIQGGTRAGLETVEPVLSPQVWTSIATGVRPATHGVKDFFVTSRDVRVKRLWEVVDENGMTSGVMSYLVTWPPEKTKGFLVPGWLAQDTRTFPADLDFLKSLEQREKTRAGYSPGEALGMAFAAFRSGTTLGTVNQAAAHYLRRFLGRGSPFYEAFSGRALKLSLTTDVFCHLLRRQGPELGIFYYSSIDAIEHQFFQYYAPTAFPSVTAEDVAHYGDLIPRIYEAADAALARILDASEPGATLVIASDHGQEPATALGGAWYVIRTSELLEVLGLSDSVRATNVGRGVFMRPNPGREAAFEDAVARLETGIVTTEGEPLFDVSRPAPDEALLEVHPDFSFDRHTEVRAADRALEVQRLIDDAPQVSGAHTDVALFLMAGEGVAKGKTLPGGSVLDIAPTILHLLGLPIARDLEGRVLVEAFDEPSRGARRDRVRRHLRSS
jgi:predicted AlkP superfamily phosphohydrolase/phosphomutase